MTRTSLSPCVVVALALAACPTVEKPRPFGAPCTANSDCTDPALQCRSVDGALPACVPPRQPTEPGEACANAIVALDPDGDGPVVVDERVLIGAAAHDVDVCGFVEQPAVSVRFTLAAPKGLFIRVDDPSVVVGLREVVDGECRGAAVRFGCATSAEQALLPSVPAGEYELVIDGPGTAVGTQAEQPVRVVVEEVNCPLGGVPFGGDCLVYQPEARMLLSRAGAGGAELASGNIIVVGGVDEDGRGLGNGEVLIPTTSERFFVETFNEHEHPIIIEDGGLVAAISPNSSPPRLDAVQFRVAFNSPRLDVQDVFDPQQVFTAAQADVGFVFTELGEFAVRADNISCDSDADCDLGTCNGFCTCTPGDCFALGGDLTSGDLASSFGPNDIAVGAGSRVLVSSPERVRVFVVQGAILRADREIPRVAPRDRVGFAVDSGRFVYGFGGVIDGEPSATVELIDLNTRTLETLDVVAPVALARPQVAVMGRLAVITDEQLPLDEPLLFDLDARRFVRAPLLPAPRADMALIGTDGGVYFAGGREGDVATNDVQRLVVVPPNRAPFPRPEACASAALGAAPTEGSTGLGLDRFRDPVCFSNALSPDQQWHVDLTEDRSLRIITAGTDFSTVEFRVTITDGLCDPKAHVIACGIGTVFVPSLPAGRYYVSVESIISFNPNLEEILGRDYEVQAILGAPEACTADAFDPGDDVAEAPRRISPAVDAENTFTFAVAEGSLCPGDVDNVLVDFVGGPGDAMRAGPAQFATVRPAVIDPTSTRDNIVIQSLGAPIDFTAFADVDQPQGFYVFTMAPSEGLLAPIEWFVQDTSDCALDDVDSSLAFLDDGDNLALAPTLAAGVTLSRNLCTPTDTDLIVIDADPARSVIVEIEEEDLQAEALSIVDDAVGPPLAEQFVVVDPDFGPQRLTLAAGQRFAIRVSHPDGDIVESYDVSLDQPPPGDACTDPLVLTGTSGTEALDSAQFRDDINVLDVGGCAPFRTPGEDIIFTIDLDTGATLTADVAVVGDFDPSVYILDGCPAGDFADICVAGVDDGDRGEPETLVFTNTGAPATFQLVIDSFFGASWQGTLTWSVQ